MCELERGSRVFGGSQHDGSGGMHGGRRAVSRVGAEHLEFPCGTLRRGLLVLGELDPQSTCPVDTDGQLALHGMQLRLQLSRDQVGPQTAQGLDNENLTVWWRDR